MDDKSQIPDSSLASNARSLNAVLFTSEQKVYRTDIKSDKPEQQISIPPTTMKSESEMFKTRQPPSKEETLDKENAKSPDVFKKKEEEVKEIIEFSSPVNLPKLEPLKKCLGKENHSKLQRFIEFMKRKNVNYIRTTKYTFLSFIPLNIVGQLLRLSNLYFILVFILQLIPGVSPFFPITTLLPLIFIFGTTLLKDGIEDFGRYLADVKANNREAERFNIQKRCFESIKTSHIGQGDIIRLKRGQSIPCDMIMLSSSKSDGSAFVETANLDGETNLKRKQAILSSKESMQSSDNLADSILDLSNPEKKFPMFELSVEENSEKLNEFRGKMIHGETKHALTVENLLLRGCSIRNTESLIGIACFIGRDTKLFRNLKKSKLKLGRMDKQLNLLVFVMFLFQQIVVLILAICGTGLTRADISFHLEVIPVFPGLPAMDQDASYFSYIYFVLSYITSFILIETFIPMSLFVCVELVKLFQAKLMEYKIVDRKFADPDEIAPGQNNTRYMVAKSSNLNGDLAHIDMIFADKTGTLTKNRMEYRTSYVLGKYYGYEDSGIYNEIEEIQTEKISVSEEEEIQITKEESSSKPDQPITKEEEIQIKKEEPPKPEQSITSTKEEEIQIKKEELPKSEQTIDIKEEEIESMPPKDDDSTTLLDRKRELEMFLLNVAMNNTVTPCEKKRPAALGKTLFDSISNSNLSQIEKTMELQNLKLPTLEKILHQYVDLGFDGESTDEVTLVSQLCRNNGVVLTKRQKSQLEINFRGEIRTYELLAVMKFNSDRKRMSVIVKCLKTNQIYFFSKGADSQMFKRNNADAKTLENYKESTLKLSCDGLRTLVFGYKILSDSDCSIFSDEYQAAQCTFRNREEKVEQVCDKWENGFTLLGITGVEDELQKGVPETLKFLGECGIPVWMLTGDKVETAINICYSANLIDKGNTWEIMLTSKSYNFELPILKKRVQKLVEYFQKDENDKKSGESSSRETKKFLQMTKRFFDYLNKNVETFQGDSREEKYSIIFDSVSLQDMLNHFQTEFIEIIKNCSSVVCARVTPLQKAIVTELVQKKLNIRGLAVGDGANDVSMISKAYVGVGIMGREGSQAARASDFAIPKFRYLKELLAVEGRYAYIGLSDVILLSLYKNLIKSFSQIFFQFFNFYSGQTIVNSWVDKMYNIVFHSIPPVLFGVFEKDIGSDLILKNPKLYKNLRKTNYYFSPYRIALWLGLGATQAASIFFFLVSFNINSLLDYGMTGNGTYTLGHVLTSILMVTVFITNAFELKTWDSFILGSIVLSFCAYVLFVLVIGLFPDVIGDSTFFFIPLISAISVNFYINVLFLSVLAVAPFYFFKIIQRKLFPTMWQKISQEKSIKPSNKTYPCQCVDELDEYVVRPEKDS